MDCGCFANSRQFIPDLVQIFGRNALAFAPLKLPEDLPKMVQPIIRSLWSRVIVIEVVDDELRRVNEDAAI